MGANVSFVALAVSVCRLPQTVFGSLGE